MVDSRKINQEEIEQSSKPKPLVTDIFEWLENANTIKDIHIKNPNNSYDAAIAAFNGLLDEKLSKVEIFGRLNQMNADNQLLHKSQKFGVLGDAKPKENVLKQMADGIFARVQYNRLLNDTTLDPAVLALLAQTVKTSGDEKSVKDYMIEMLSKKYDKKGADTPEEAIGLTKNVTEVIKNIDGVEVNDVSTLKELIKKDRKERDIRDWWSNNNDFRGNGDVNRPAMMSWNATINAIRLHANRRTNFLEIKKNIESSENIELIQKVTNNVGNFEDKITNISLYENVHVESNFSILTEKQFNDIKIIANLKVKKLIEPEIENKVKEATNTVALIAVVDASTFDDVRTKLEEKHKDLNCPSLVGHTGDDQTWVDDDAANKIQDAAKTRLSALNKDVIVEAFENAAKGSDDDGIQSLIALVDVNYTTGDAFRGFLVTNKDKFPNIENVGLNGHEDDELRLLNSDTEALYDEAKKKLSNGLTKKITAVIKAIGDTANATATATATANATANATVTAVTDDQIAALKAVADAGDDATKIRKALADKHKDLGIFDLTGHTDDSWLSDDEAKEIRKLTIQKYNELYIKDCIAKNDGSAEKLAALKIVASVKKDNVADILKNIRKQQNTLFPAIEGDVTVTGDEAVPTDEAAKEIHGLTIQKHNALQLRKSIVACKDGEVLTALIKAVKDSKPNEDPVADTVRTALNTNKEHIYGNNLVGELTDGDPVLSDDDAIAIQQQMIQQVIVSSILTDKNKDNFTSLLVSDADDDTVKTYVTELLKKPNYDSLKLEDNKRLDVTKLTDNSIKEIKKAIIARQENFITDTIKAEITKLALSPADSHPKLIDLIKNFHIETKTALVADNAKNLISLLTAKTDHEALAAARACKLDEKDFFGESRPFALNATKELFSGLLEENKRNLAFRRIANSKVAEVLGQFSVKFDEETIKKFNNAIIKDRNAPVDYNSFVKDICDATGLEAAQISSLSDVLNNTDVKKEVEEQLTRNKELHAKLREAVNPKKNQVTAVLHVLARIQKTDALSEDEVSALTKACCEATTHAKLVTSLKNQDTDDLKNAVDKLSNWENVLNENEFEYFISQNFLDDLSTGKKEDSSRAIDEINKNLNGVIAEYKLFQNKDKAVQVDLDHLANANPIKWIAPGAVAIARKHAAKLQGPIEMVAKKCDETCRMLRRTERMYMNLLKSLPSNSSFSKVQKSRENVIGTLKQVQQDLKRYEKLHRTLYGDPLASEPGARQGFLDIIKSAQNSNKTMKFTGGDWNVAVELFDLKDKKDKLGAAASGGAVTNTTMGANNASPTFIPSEKDLASDKGILYTVNSGFAAQGKPSESVQGTFIEERGSLEVERGADGKEARQKVTMTVVKFPGKCQKADDTKEAQVRYALTMAGQMLASIGDRPSEENPIVLRGNNPEELAMLWTALVVLGEQMKKVDSRYGFTPKAIDVRSKYFEPLKEKAFFGNWADASKYKTHFEGSQSLKSMQNAIKSYYDEGFGKKDARANKDVTSLFKSLVKGLSKDGGAGDDNDNEHTNNTTSPSR